MRVAAYTRVSSAAQATEEKASLTEQHIDIEKYCEQRGHQIVEWYQDIGSGASKRRPDFQRMLKDSQSNKFDLIVAWKSDRLSRGMYPAAALMEALEGMDIKLEAVKDTIDINTFGILAAVGKIELDNIRQRVSMGMRGRARKGKAPSHIRFGYRKDEQGYPIIKEQEAKVVRRIFELYVEGHTAQEIADALNQDGIPTARGLTWAKGSITELLKYPNYGGTGYFGRKRRVYRDVGNDRVSRISYYPKEDWIEVPYPPIIDDATWKAAQQIREKNKNLRAHKGLNPQFPLRGLIWCGSCGHRFNTHMEVAYGKRKGPDGTTVRVKTGKHRRRYQCHGAASKKLGCPRRSIGAKKVEEAVWAEVRRLLEHPESIKTMLDARRTELESGGAWPELERVKQELEAIKQKEQRIVTAFVNEYIDEEGMATQMSLIKERKEHFQQEVTRLEDQASNAGEELQMLDSFQAAADGIRESLGDLDHVNTGEVIRLLVSRVEVFADYINVEVIPSKGALDQVTALFRPLCPS